MKCFQKIIIEHLWLLQRQRRVTHLTKKKLIRRRRGSYTGIQTRTSRAAPTNAGQSILGKKPLRKSGLNSASLSSIRTSLNSNGKLSDVQPLAWHARRLCVIRRTIVDVFRVFRRQFIIKCDHHHHPSQSANSPSTHSKKTCVSMDGHP